MHSDEEDVLKTSWRRISTSASEDVFKTSSRRLDQDEYIRLRLKSSEDVFKTSSRCLSRDQYIRLGHTFSKRPQDVLQKHIQYVFKTFSTRLAKISSRRFQDVSSSQTDFINTSSRSIQHVSERFFSKDGYLQRDLPRLHYFWEIYGQCRKFAIWKRDKNFSSFRFSFYYTF